jgi:hypothetical protein
VQIRGEWRIGAPRRRVWTTLLDRDALEQAIPGCDSLVERAPDSYEVTVKVGVAMLRGSVSGRVTIERFAAERSLRAVAEGDSDGGALAGVLTVELEDAGEGTQLSYVAGLSVIGAPSSPAGRVLEGVAKAMAGRFFGAIAERAERAGAAAPDAVE